MTVMRWKQVVSIASVALCSSWVCAQTSQEAVKTLQKQWAVDNYQLTGKAQKDAFVELVAQADKQVEAYPNAASVYIWRGIIQSTYAGVKGGLGALSYAKSAKRDLEKAISLDGTALNGSAYTSLGSLYFNVPGWPIGFGDDDKAETLLKKALDINPNGIDSNYFYADFLRSEKRYSESIQHLQKALNAEPRSGRELADSGRRKDIETLLLEVKKHLK